MGGLGPGLGKIRTTIQLGKIRITIQPGKIRITIPGRVQMPDRRFPNFGHVLGTNTYQEEVV